jgi:hypothetical protein
MSARRTDTVVKFPIGRVVREHRIGIILAATPKAEAIEQALRSINHAIVTLRRQEATLNLHAARERKKVTPKQHAQLVAKNMRHIYACRARPCGLLRWPARTPTACCLARHGTAGRHR